MIEAGSPEIDADESMMEVREEFARGSVETDGSPIAVPAARETSRVAAAAAENLPVEDKPFVTPAPQTLAPQLPTLPPPANIPLLNLQPEFRSNPDDRYHINDLLQYHDRHFVENAYLATLKRPPRHKSWRATWKRCAVIVSAK